MFPRPEGPALDTMRAVIVGDLQGELREPRPACIVEFGMDLRELARQVEGAVIRDSKHPEAGFLPLGASVWAAFARLIAERPSQG